MLRYVPGAEPDLWQVHVAKALLVDIVVIGEERSGLSLGLLFYQMKHQVDAVHEASPGSVKRNRKR